jgi:hypothetical protein
MPEPERDQQPQFPNTPEGQLAKMFKRESLENLRQERDRATADRIEQAVNRFEATSQHVIAAAVKGAIEAVFTQLQLPLPVVGVAKVANAAQAEPVLPKHHWAIEEWNHGYEAFRAHIVRKYKPGTSKPVFAGSIGLTERTLNRAMSYFHLPSRLWPPDQWPKTMPPEVPPSRLKRVLKAMIFGYLALDVSDGKLDGVIHLCRVLHPHLRLF